MSTFLNHVYSRGLDTASRHLSHKFANIEDLNASIEDLNVPTWGFVLVALTAFVWVVASALAEYTFSRLIPALVMVESPQPAVYLPLGENEPDATLDSKVEEELFLVKQTPITSSFRSTLRHLRSVGGYRSRYRGFRVFAVTQAATYFVYQSIAIPLRFFPRPLGTTAVLTAVLLANLSMTWTHVIMSSPSEKAWFRRIPSFKTWKKIAVPTAICTFAQQLAIYLPVQLSIGLKVRHLFKDDNRNNDPDMLPLNAIIVIFVTIFMMLMVALPAKVVLTRVQASLLAEDQETIIPFDRSFNGKASEQDGVIGLVQAWKTFHRSSLIRLIKTYVKSFAIQVALAMFFGLVLAAEGLMILGPEKIMKLGGMATNPNFDEIRILPVDN